MVKRFLTAVYVQTILILVALSASATDFVVRTNADTGDGSLRAALVAAAANGNLGQDRIIFDISGISLDERTIVLGQQLPDLSSNLTIDASMQPGAAFGVSTAKVRLRASYEIGYAGMLQGKDLTGIQIYAISFVQNNPVPNSAAVFLNGCTSITIGAVGKGNHFESIGLGIYPSFKNNETDPFNFPDNVKISANLIGIEDDGATGTVVEFELFSMKNLTFGGPTPPEGNVINCQVEYNSDILPASASGRVLFANNKIGVNPAGTTLVNRNVGTISFSMPNEVELEVLDNQFCGKTSLMVQMNHHPFRIARNKFGTDASGTQVLGLDEFAVRFNSSYGGIFGGPNPADGNLISGTFSTGAIHSNIRGSVINQQSRNIEMINNVFRCNNTAINYDFYAEPSRPEYTVSITSRNATGVQGKATPNSRVDLYYSLSCTFCESEQLFAQTSADTNGDWKYIGPLQDHTIIASATLNGQTSEFTNARFEYSPQDIIIKPACNDGKGSITGLSFLHASGYGWYNAAGELVSTDIDLVAVAGRYQFRLSTDYCVVNSPFYEIGVVNINVTDVQIYPAYCTYADGAISIGQSNATKFTWYDRHNEIAGTAKDVTGLRAGIYTLVAGIGDCSKTFGPFTVTLNNGYSINEDAKRVTNSTCGESNGSILGVIGVGITGLPTYTWRNERQETVGNQPDLQNVPAGKYVLEVRDETRCPVYSTDIELTSLGEISIDESLTAVIASGCGNPTGSIKGIVVTGGATKYEWLDESASVYRVTANPELTNAPGGKYRLRASRSANCFKLSSEITITQPAAISFVGAKSALVRPCADQKGSIAVDFGDLAGQITSLEWRNTIDQPIGSAATIKDLLAGTYFLYVNDINGCRNLFNAFELEELPALVVDDHEMVKTDDQCDYGNGSITGLKIIGGSGTQRYSWRNSANVVVATTLDLSALSEGSYTLEISEDSRCSVLSGPYLIANTQGELVPPVLSDVEVCSAGAAVIAVQKAAPGTYRIYRTAAGGVALSQNNTGVFEVNAGNESVFYVSFSDGTCESSRTEVTVKVGESDLRLSSAFSPNGDGKNDTWQIPDLENYPECQVRIFNRAGTIVYSATGYKTAFDGKSKGTDLPVGVYYYVISLRQGCKELSGSLTLVR